VLLEEHHQMLEVRYQNHQLVQMLDLLLVQAVEPTFAV
jgi:hypothetical protein